MQKDIGFIHISDALTEAMLDHPRERQKSKNERHAAHSGAKRNERHAAWERFSMGPQSGPPKIAQSMYF